ncbi:hypothetical protein LIA77_02239 [Sarocladium implicatum]|nr:hypothetical protein LIA77_02239 [Sarocladium implicatum]
MRQKRLALPRRKLQLRPGAVAYPPSCLFCSLAAPATRPHHRPLGSPSRRFQSTSATARDPRTDLRDTLEQLETKFPNLVPRSKLQLAVRGLQQNAGNEAVRLAILSLADPTRKSTSTAREVLRLLLADPLVDEEQWERDILDHPAGEPLIIRIRASKAADGTLSISRSNTLAEVEISSPELNGADLEILILELNLPAASEKALSPEDIEELVLEPTVQLPGDAHSTELVTPVHKAIIVGEGFSGASSLASLSFPQGRDTVLTAANLKGLASQEIEASFEVIDTDIARQGIQLFRKGPQHGIEYERLWFASNLPALTRWLKSGIKSTDGVTKPAVRNVITASLQSTIARIEAARSVEESLSTKAPSASASIRTEASTWAQNAHAELQDQLDLAFTGRRWRKLGWWKLFWRVDDVAMLTNEMLTQRFLPTSEQELVYLTGQIKATLDTQPTFSQPASSQDDQGKTKRLGSGEVAPVVFPATANGLPKWPGHIAFTRRYLQNETVPALQALAQKLVLQAIGTSSVTTSLAALLYVSSFASSLYEAGAVAALGVMYSLGRMQKKWETARGFWEGEVREEGRKAVRAAEQSVAGALDAKAAVDDALPSDAELQEARELVSKAEEALERLK